MLFGNDTATVPEYKTTDPRTSLLEERAKGAVMTEKITIRDIARLAGVSKSTVSRVLNQKQDVDPATRECVLRIVEEQAFVASSAASGLAGGRSRLIGTLIPSLTWPLIPEILRGVAEVVAQSPYELLLYSITHDKDRTEKDQRDIIDRILTSKLAGGLLAVFPGQSTQHLTQLHEQGFPVVIIDDQNEPTSTPWVSADDRVGAYNAVRYLIHLGHRRIGYIHGPLNHQCTHDRYQGYCDALSDAGLTPDPSLVLQGDFMFQGGCACASQFFALAERPTAIFASNDAMAYGVLATAEEYGLLVPEDISLVGFDDIPLSAHARSTLTTVHQPFYEMGQRATELLLSLLESPRPLSNGPYTGPVQLGTSPFSNKKSEPIRIQLGTNLVVRTSCGSPRLHSVSTPEALSSM